MNAINTNSSVTNTYEQEFARVTEFFSGKLLQDSWVNIETTKVNRNDLVSALCAKVREARGIQCSVMDRKDGSTDVMFHHIIR
jgi:hypothetical protein